MVGRLLVAYNTQTGIPYNSVVLDTLEVQNPTWTRRSSTLSEFGSMQLEFAKLSMHSGNPVYNEKAESVIQYLYEKYPEKVKDLACKKWLPAYNLSLIMCSVSMRTVSMQSEQITRFRHIPWPDAGCHTVMTVYVRHCHGGTTQKGFAIGCINGSWPDFKPHAYV